MLVKHKKQNRSKSGGIVMNKLNFKKRVSLLLALIMLFSSIMTTESKAQELGNEFVYGYDNWSSYDYEYNYQDHIFDEVSRLINDNWCYNFVGRINFRPGCSFMEVDGIQNELDSEAVPVMEYDEIILPLNPIIEIIGEDISLEPLMRGMTIGDEIVMLPVSSIAEHLGFEYYWDSEEEKVILTRHFQTRRLIVKTFGEVNLEYLGATDVVRSFDNVVYLQFATIEETRVAFDKLLISNEIEWVEPDLVITLHEMGIQEAAFEPFSAGRWDNVGRVGTDRYAQYLRSIGRGNYRSVVAVLDTGVQSNHHLLDGRVLDGRNFVNNTYNTSDPHGHGTHVAGVIIANTPGLDVRIMPIVIASTQERPTLSRMRLGVNWAITRRVDVINISASIELPPLHTLNLQLRSLENEINRAIDNEIVVVVSAGHNSVNVNTLTPARMSRVITVAASTRLSNMYRNTNFGAGVCISAPGMDIFGPWNNSNTEVMTGTSFAAPHVSAAAAMTLIRHPELSPAEVRLRLRHWTNRPDGWNANRYGAGILDMSRAIPVGWVPPNAPSTWSVTAGSNRTVGTTADSWTFTATTNNFDAANVRIQFDGSSQVYQMSRSGNSRSWFFNAGTIRAGNPRTITITAVAANNIVVSATHYVVVNPSLPTHTVTFWPNDGGSANRWYTQNFVHGQAQYLRRNTWQRPGYTFVGWASIPNGNVHYTEGQRVNILASHHLYAVWRPVGRATITSVTTTNNGRVTVNWTSSGNATNY
ncbi:MAG: S8 family serine peptidase, partial [Oscillospiraceae bacterium]|nr:S8 family serine peptidase [Oscillospiraceae bacterium]